MAPHRNHVEARSSREPARQYVAESHDHKPDAPSKPQIYLGLGYSKDIIIAARAALVDDGAKLEGACRRLNEAFAAQKMVDVKLAIEDVQRYAGEIENAGRTIKYQAAGILKASIGHLNRRPRA